LSGEHKPKTRHDVLNLVSDRLADGVDIGPLKLPADVRKAARKAFGHLPKGV
jgi:hypothetical protein